MDELVLFFYIIFPIDSIIYVFVYVGLCNLGYFVHAIVALKARSVRVAVEVLPQT
jgi:hypothetical protein